MKKLKKIINIIIVIFVVMIFCAHFILFYASDKYNAIKNDISCVDNRNVSKKGRIIALVENTSYSVDYKYSSGEYLYIGCNSVINYQIKLEKKDKSNWKVLSMHVKYSSNDSILVSKTLNKQINNK